MQVMCIFPTRQSPDLEHGTKRPSGRFFNVYATKQRLLIYRRCGDPVEPLISAQLIKGK